MNNLFWHFSDGLMPVTQSTGMHRALDALEVNRGPIVSLVELRGKRCVVAMADATAVLHRFAIWCAARALRQGEVTDPRCWHALRVKSRWLVGRATYEELRSAREAAYAARDSAYSAAYATATAACAYAVYTTAANAVYVAYTAATAYAARSAASYAYAAERDRQNEEFERRLLKLLRH